MKVLKLTDAADSNSVWVVADKINVFQLYHDLYSNKVYTAIDAGSPELVLVKETPEEIIRLLDEIQ